VGTLFAAFLGVNPVQHLLAPSGVLATLPPQHAAALTGRTFFAETISAPFHQGLTVVFAAAAGMTVIAALASVLRGGARQPQKAG
jgi:predicted RND superfamily exporter protein